jgi:tetratricopeptide (TPR) repeat protein
LALLVALRLQNSSMTDKTPEKLFIKVETLISRKKYLESLKLSQQIARLPGLESAGNFFSAATYLAMGDCANAAATLRRIEGWGSQKPQYWAMLGDACVGLGQFSDATGFYKTAIDLGAQSEALTRNYANTLIKSRKFSEAYAVLKNLIALYPPSAATLSSMSNVCFELEKPEDAKAFAQRAIELESSFGEAWLNLSRALLHLGQFEAAERACTEALRLNPKNAGAYGNMGILAQYRRDWADAERGLRRAFTLSSDAQDALNLAALLLETGNFKEGWSLYRHRKSGPSFQSRGRSYAQKELLGVGEGADSVVLWAEQGIGDQILFLSCLPDLSAYCPNIILDLDQRLVPLLRSSFPTVAFFDELTIDPNLVQRQLPLGDLLEMFRPELGAFPLNRKSYLTPSRESTEAVSKWFPIGKPRCAISWRSARRLHGLHKSVDLRPLLSTAAEMGFQVFNVQYGDDSAAEFSEACRALGIEGFNITQFSVTDDFDLTAAFLLSCDVVISSSNSLLHLAGSVGANVVGVLPSVQSAFWYWHRPLGYCPWYPQLRRVWMDQAGRFNKNELRTILSEAVPAARRELD